MWDAAGSGCLDFGWLEFIIVKKCDVSVGPNPNGPTKRYMFILLYYISNTRI
jgi:hypothetical protein